MTTSTPRRTKVLAPVVSLVAAATLLGACSGVEQSAAAATGHSPSHHSATSSKRQSKVALRNAMRKLWSDHMQWTYATVDAFFHNQAALQPTLDRLLRNQREIGDAVKPFFGRKAGNALADLLTEHINGAVPVLQAAQAGDQAALDTALAAWHANSKEIADFLSKANPRYWPASATEPMMKAHIDQTTTYAVDLLKGDYAAAIGHFDEAYDHMMMLADTLTKGIVGRFPNKFAR